MGVTVENFKLKVRLGGMWTSVFHFHPISIAHPPFLLERHRNQERVSIPNQDCKVASAVKTYETTHMAASGSGDSARNSNGPPLNKKPSHLSIDSSSANNAFLHTLNSQLQIAANKSQADHQHENGAVDFPLSVGIDRAALIAPDFDTDEFLSARRHLPLEELKSQVSTTCEHAGYAYSVMGLLNWH